MKLEGICTLLVEYEYFSFYTRYTQSLYQTTSFKQNDPSITRSLNHIEACYRRLESIVVDRKASNLAIINKAIFIWYLCFSAF